MITRVLHLIASNFVGGPEKQILHHARDLAAAQSRYHIEVASFQDEATRPEIIGAATRVGIRATCLPGGISVNALTGLTDMLRDRKFDLLCTHGYKANILGRFATRGSRTVQIAFVRGWTAETSRVALYEHLERRLLRTIPHVVCVSKAQAEQLARTRGKRPAPIVIPNAVLPPFGASEYRHPVPLNKLRIPKGAFVFGSVGRLSVEKGHRYLLEAFARLTREVPEKPVFLIVLGDGRELEHLQAQADRLGILKQVFFAGFQRDCDTWMRLLDAIVQPSLTEGTPNSLLEALYYRLPIVATAVGGVPDLISSGVNGLLVPPADPAALCAGMKDVLTSADLRQQLASGAEIVMHDYSPATQRERLIHLYRTALKSRPRVGVMREVERETAA